VSDHLRDRQFFANDLAEFLTLCQQQLLFPRGSVVFLNGPLGAGKSTLVQALCETRGIKATSSPTFSLQNRYTSLLGDVILHWDLYRIETAEELFETGFWDQFSEDFFWLFIEWPKFFAAEDFPVSAPVYSIDIDLQGAGDLGRQLRVRRVS
jgi:tRNA threonylcarbamoyladenosine biosynthesis protein TsaE